MPTYLFHLGQTPRLSSAELHAVYPNCTWEPVILNILSCELEDDAAAAAILNRTGGVVKVSKIEQYLDQNEESVIQEALVGILAAASHETQLNFSIYAADQRLEVPSLTTVKKVLRAAGHKSRYIEAADHGLSAAVLLHQTVLELNLFLINDKVLITRTVAIQNIDDWTQRDRSKPYFDRKKGMLPPKVARIMTNLALRDSSLSSARVYDPFCGTGTVLLEAAHMGVTQLYGSDNDPDAVGGSRLNLNWLNEYYQLQPPVDAKLWVSDVAAVRADQTGKPITAIVTEPYLGKPKPMPGFIPNMFKGLEKLYLGAFKAWQKILAPGGRVVIVLPAVQLGTRLYDCSDLIDKLTKLGYTTSSEPIVYARPQAIVQRQIYQFVYQPQ
jgi:tRNA G10  N-methylase Trm11